MRKHIAGVVAVNLTIIGIVHYTTAFLLLEKPYNAQFYTSQTSA